MRSFVNSSGIATQLASPSAGVVFEEPAPGEALEVSDEAVLALFGRDRTALLRVLGLPMQDHCRWSCRGSGSFGTLRSSKWKRQASGRLQIFASRCSSTRSSSSSYPSPVSARAGQLAGTLARA
jgi:hypothetical protein